MNLLILILIVFIYSIKPLTAFELNNALVFIKPENLTKTELVEKFKELSSSKSLKDLKKINNEDKKDDDKITFKNFLKSYYSRFSAFILKYKNLISKIALFTILIKYLRKFKLMRIIIRIINYIFLSTFGILITDIYGLKEIIAQIEFYWMEYVNLIHENKIYKTLVKIFHVTDENKSKVIENKSEIIENKSETKINNSEIPSSGRELKNEKIIHDKTSGGNEKENWFKLNKYFWIGLSIISLSLIYVYRDSIIELFKSVKPDLGKDGDGSDTSSYPIFRSYQEEYEKYFHEINTNKELYDLEVIRYQNKGKAVDYSDLEVAKWGDSPTTPKASTSRLPERDVVMIPISEK